MPPAAPAPVPLDSGEKVEVVDVFAAAVWTRSYLVDGQEKVTWKLEVEGGYDIIFSSEVACEGLSSRGVRRREVTERERGEAFEGFVDFAQEHADLLRSIGAESSKGGKAVVATSSAVPVLKLSLDNSYSFFTAKRVRLTVTKTNRYNRHPQTFVDVLAPYQPGERWRHAVMLIDRSWEVGVPVDVDTYEIALHACKGGGQWEVALRMLEEMQSKGVTPTARSYDIVVRTCEQCGQADKALSLLDKVDRALVGPTTSNGTSAENGDDVEFLRSSLVACIARCPPEANEVMDYLLKAQAAVEKSLGPTSSGRRG